MKNIIALSENSSPHYALLFRIARRVDAIVILPFGNGRNARGSVFPVHTMTLLEVLLGHVITLNHFFLLITKS